MADNTVIQALVSQAASKGFHLYHCTPLTGASSESWIVHRGARMKFFKSLEELQAHVETMEEYKPLSPAVLAQEANLREALAETLL